MAGKSFVLKIRESDKNIFGAIKSGKKDIETRAATPKYRKIKPGDELVFVCGSKRIKKIVKSAELYKTIGGLLSDYKVRRINPDLKTKGELSVMYESFPGYEEKIKKYGLIAWGLETV